MRIFNGNFIGEKNKRSPDGPKPVNLVTFNFATPVYISDRNITPPGGPAHAGIIKDWGFIDSSIAQTSDSGLLGKLEISDLQMELINMGFPPFSNNFTSEDPPENVIVEVYQWFEGLEDYSEKELLFKGIIWGQPVYNLYECKIVIRGIFEKYNKLIGESLVITDDSYPDSDIGSIGKMLPISYGNCKTVPFRAIKVGAVTTLAADINDSDTTITVSNSGRLDAPGLVLIDNEIIYFAGLSGEQLTGCIRGWAGTLPVAHNTDARAEEILEHLIYAVGHPIKSVSNVYIKDSESGLCIRQTGNYTIYTGQSGNEHSLFPGKGIIEFGWPSQVPSGLIVPFNYDSLPAGWEWFNSANEKMIIGAGGSFGVGAVGGSASIIKMTVNNMHAGSWSFNCLAGPSGSGTCIKSGTSSDNHIHNHTLSFDYLPSYQDLRLIRATQDQIEFPAFAVVFAHTSHNPDPANLLNAFSVNKFLRGNNDRVSGGGYSNLTITTSEDHVHYELCDSPGSSAYYATQLAAGTHNHNENLSSFSAVENIKKTYLRALTNTSGFRGAGGIIAMWESLTPPDGWVICDGNNGTIDLRDYFIMLSSSENIGIQAGNNTVDFNTTSESGGGHSHEGSIEYGADYDTVTQHKTQNAHQHHTVWQENYIPPYYALVFIMKKYPQITIQGNLICADIEGYCDDNSGTYTDTPNALIERPDHVFKHLWNGILGAPLTDIDAPSFSNAGIFFATNNYKFSHVLTNPIDARVELMNLAFQCRSRFLVMPTGQAKLFLRQTGQTSNHAIIYNEIKLNSVSIQRSSVSDLLNYFNIYYNLDYSKDDMAKENCQAAKKFSDSTSISRYGQREWKGDETLFIFNAVSSDEMIQHVGDFILSYYKQIRKIPQFEVFLDNMEIEPGDIIDITHPLDNMTNFACEVIKIIHHMGSASKEIIDHLKIITMEN